MVCLVRWKKEETDDWKLVKWLFLPFVVVLVRENCFFFCGIGLATMTADAFFDGLLDLVDDEEDRNKGEKAFDLGRDFAEEKKDN